MVSCLPFVRVLALGVCLCFPKMLLEYTNLQHTQYQSFLSEAFGWFTKTGIYGAILQLHLSFLVLRCFLLWPTITFNSWPYLRVPSSSFFSHACYNHISVVIRDDYLIGIMWLPHNADDSMVILNCVENCVMAVLRSSVHFKHQQTFKLEFISGEPFVPVT